MPYTSRDSVPFSRRGTSEEAAVLTNSMRDRGRVYRFLKKRKKSGATDEEIEHGLCLLSNTARPRRHDLMRMGFVVDSGMRRETRSGRNAIVWILKRSE